MPDNSLLYCSERSVSLPPNLAYINPGPIPHLLRTLADCPFSCRRKDSCKPLSASCPSTTAMSSSTTPPSSPPMSPRMIVAPLTPTRVSVKSSAPIRIPGEHHDATTDLDPTEWKPVIPLGASVPGRFSTLASSEAWNYLSQFHEEPLLPARRSGAGNRGSTTSLSAFSAPGTLPALAHTPSTMASSFSSNASDGSGPLHEAAHQRPLPPRHKGTSKSVELVVPHAGAPVVDVTAPESDHGSIFPASSSLWDTSEKTQPE